MSLDSLGKVVPYIPIGDSQLENVGQHRLQIRNTKQESSFLRFREPSSAQSIFCKLASEDPLLRLLFFLRLKVGQQPDERYPVTVTIPIVLSESTSYSSLMKLEDTKKRKAELQQQQEALKKDMKAVATSSTANYMKIFASDTEFRSRLLSGRLQRQDMDELFDRIISREKDRFARGFAEAIEPVARMMAFMQEQMPVLEAVLGMDDAQHNRDKLAFAVTVSELSEQLGNSLSKLVGNRICRVTTRSTCPECTLRKGIEPYRIEERYAGKPSLRTKCEKCAGEAIYHQIGLELDHTFGPLLQERFLPEFAVGYSIARLDRIRKVFVHKKVQLMKEEMMPGVEVDVLALTTDDRILAIEVTAQSDWNNVMKEEREKEETLKRIPYDYLLYLTSVNEERAVRFGNAMIMTSKHIAELDQWVANTMDGRLPT